MRAYVIRRVLLLIPTFLLLSILVFLSVRFLPGDAVDALAGKMQYVVGDIDREAVERMLGLDQPVYVQYGRWLGDIFLHGTLGNSLLGDWRVEERILGRLPATLELGVMAIVIGLLIGLPVGIYSAMRRNTAADYVGRVGRHHRLGDSQLLAGDLDTDLSRHLVGLVAAVDARAVPHRSAGQHRRVHRAQLDPGHLPCRSHHADDAHHDAGGAPAGRTSGPPGRRGSRSGS